MINYIAHKLTDLFVRKSIIPNDQYEIYLYGFDITIYSIASTIGIVLLGWMLGYFWPTVVILFVFSVLQTNGGGHHARSHLGCFITMVIGEIVAILMCENIKQFWLLLMIYCVSLVVLYCVPLVLHENKQYLEKHRKRLQRKSWGITTILAIGSIILGLLCFKIRNGIVIGFMLAAISRLYAAMSKKVNENKSMMRRS